MKYLGRPMFRMALPALLVVLLPVPAPGAPEDRATGSAGTAPTLESYVIRPSDVLEIFVWRETDLSRKVQVRPDGKISFPLVQDLAASGLTPAQLKEEIERELSHYLEAPNVTVLVDSIRHYKIFVIGRVQNPGGFESEKAVTVLQALSMAGGFQDFADKGQIRIIRKTDNGHRVYDFNYSDVIGGRKAEQNITLFPGDVVAVP